MGHGRGKTKGEESRRYHIIVLGTGGVGKSAITVRFVQKLYTGIYDPTIEDSYRKDVTMDGKLYPLEILDTAGADQFTAMKDTYMKKGDGFVLVYSVESPSSFEELESIRDGILKIRDTDDLPMILVANKCDLEDRKVSKEQGESLSKKFNDCPFIEASAKEDINIDDIFMQLIQRILKDKFINDDDAATNCKCIIL